MILVCEPTCWGLEHVPINTSVLEIIRLSFPEASITFFAERTHLGYVYSQIDPKIKATIQWESIKICPRGLEPNRRWFYDFSLSYKLLKKLDEMGDGHLVMTSITPTNLIALQLLTIFKYKNRTPVQVFLHSGISTLNQKRSRNPYFRVHEFQTAFAISRFSSLRFFVLEESIKRALIFKINHLVGRVYVLDHPLPPDENAHNEKFLNSPVHFGFLGLATEEKGFPLYLDMAKKFTNKFPGKVTFHAIGKIPLNVRGLEMSALTTTPRNCQLHREEYKAHISNLHFTCFPYQRQYELSASGALLDSIAWEKPFIAMRIPIFENLINRYGDIGYLCDSDMEFFDTMEMIVTQPDADDYLKRKYLLRKVKTSRMPQNLALRYQKACRMIN